MESFHTIDFDVERGGCPPEAHSFLIAQALGGGEIAERAAESSAAFGVPVVPFAGVAAPLSHVGERQQLQSSNAMLFLGQIWR